MKNKYLVVFFILPFILIMLVLEVNYYINGKKHRHNIDYIVKEQVANMKDKNYNTIILGDSVAEDSFKSLSLHDSILDLSSTQDISLAGNYYILKEYLDFNNVPKNVYIFLIPKLLTNDLKNKYRYLYYTTVFNKIKQIDEMNKIEPAIFKKKKILDKQIEARVNSLLNYRNEYLPPQRNQHISIRKELLKGEKKYKKSMIIARVKVMKRLLNKNIQTIPKIYLNKILSLCKSKGIKLTIVIEPLPNKINKIFLASPIYKYIDSLGIKIINSNDFFKYKDEYFYDGTHIQGNVNSYYQNIIDEFILDIY